MTVITVKKEKDYIKICADSQISYGRYHTQTEKSNDKIMKDFSKLHQVNDMTFGSAGYLEQYLQFKHFANNNLPSGSRISDIEDYFLKFYKEMREKKDKFEPYNSFILVYEGKMFHISKYLIYEIEEWDSIGSGIFYARTALYLGKGAKEACEVAVELAGGVGGEIKEIEIKI